MQRVTKRVKMGGVAPGRGIRYDTGRCRCPFNTVGSRGWIEDQPLKMAWSIIYYGHALDHINPHVSLPQHQHSHQRPLFLGSSRYLGMIFDDILALVNEGLLIK